MRLPKTRSPRRAALPAAAMAAMMLAGCSSGHIGESWQCPLAKGGSCESVAAADPAVPDADAAQETVLDGPLWRVRGTGQAGTPASAAPCEAECGGGFDPVGWLVRLFQAKDDGEASRTPDAAARTAEPAAAALPAEPAAGETDPARDDPHGEDLRTGEVVARIWIAPFVDADGVYREASHVRVVLEPAGWRLP